MEKFDFQIPKSTPLLSLLTIHLRDILIRINKVAINQNILTRLALIQ